MLSGFGLQFWILSKLKSANDVLDLVRQTGASWVSFKVTDGHYMYSDFAANMKLYKEAAELLRENGVTVTAWGFHYGRYNGEEPRFEANAVLNARKLLGFDIYFVDAEARWRDTNKPGDARELVEPLKDAGIIVGLESWKFPTYHRQMRYAEWASVIDFFAPQVYWIARHGDITDELRRSVQEHREIAPDLPIIPIGPLFTEYRWEPKPGELVMFANEAKRLGFPFGLWKGEYLARGSKGRKLIGTVADISKMASRKKAFDAPSKSVSKPETRRETAPATEMLRYLVLGWKVEFEGKPVANVDRAFIVFADGSKEPASKILEPTATITVSVKEEKPVDERTVTARVLLVRSTPEYRKDRSNVVGYLTYGARVIVIEEKNGYAKIGDGKWVSTNYLRKVPMEA